MFATSGEYYPSLSLPLTLSYFPSIPIGTYSRLLLGLLMVALHENVEKRELVRSQNEAFPPAESEEEIFEYFNINNEVKFRVWICEKVSILQNGLDNEVW